ncbi:MAG: cytochrome c maturation protein CcmE [Gammaproteobacteria bacterium]|nr:MAG: cytochrome c maturation protein CcmE [Gammaproteobacteria bacterium]
MHPKRKQRLLIISVLVGGVGLTSALVLNALNENINLFYPPDQIVAGLAPVDQRIRAGGIVVDGSVFREIGSMSVSFLISDLDGHDVPVTFEGILPNLFGEGQGIVATGRLGADGVFVASEVLAKHDENYMPTELAAMQGRKPPMGNQVNSEPGASY